VQEHIHGLLQHVLLQLLLLLLAVVVVGLAVYFALVWGNTLKLVVAQVED
jgi:hypothetical protein